MLENIPIGFCQCGCGQKTKLSTHTINRLGIRSGEPQRFILGHRNTKVYENVPYGFCHCGCEGKTPKNKRSNTRRKLVRGEPAAYISGHGRRGKYFKGLYIGQRFGRLVIKLAPEDIQGAGLNNTWICICDCGNEVKRVGSALCSGATKSCGCQRYAFLPRGEASFRNLYQLYKRSAKERNLIFNLSRNDIVSLFKSNCVYCGIEPRQIMICSGTRGNYIYNGIDRVDNNIGYIKENCVSCCKICNRAKHAMTLQEFQNYLNRVCFAQLPKKNPQYVECEVRYA